jgi:glycosyltransferase involved in cell wall biosynthesis
LKKPEISIIVPCYNQSQFLDECLQSVLDQTYISWECIIVNDGSDDETNSIAIEWVEKDERYRYLSQGNQGVSTARNNGIEMAYGVYILPLDADDKISKEYLQKAMGALKNDKGLDLVYCNAQFFGRKSGDWNLKPYSFASLLSYNMIFNAAVFRKKDWEIAGGYDIQMVDGIEDWEFWLSLLNKHSKVKKLNLTGFYYRVKVNSRTTELDDEKLQRMYRYMTKKHLDVFLDYYGSFIELNLIIQSKRERVKEYLGSKKFAINLFCKNCFGFKVFLKFDKNTDSSIF